MFCSKCGNQIADGDSFCGKCGAVTSVKQQNTVSTAQTTNGLHCPNCKSRNLAITTESSVNGGLTTHHGAGSITSFSNSHRNYWICNDCGSKFRNIQNPEEDLKSKSKSVKILK